MTDHKFTGDDVIKTLKNAKYKVDGVVTRGFYLSPETFNAVVDLINRQKAQIESLNAVHADVTESLRLAAEANKDMQAEIEKLKGSRNRWKQIATDFDKASRETEKEIERLTAERDNEHRCYLHICEDLKQAVNRNITAKSEAIKEFAQRLKENLTGWETDPTDEEIEYTIDTLVKEMTENKR